MSMMWFGYQIVTQLWMGRMMYSKYEWFRFMQVERLLKTVIVVFSCLVFRRMTKLSKQIPFVM